MRQVEVLVLSAALLSGMRKQPQKFVFPVSEEKAEVSELHPQAALRVPGGEMVSTGSLERCWPAGSFSKHQKMASPDFLKKSVRHKLRYNLESFCWEKRPCCSYRKSYGRR